MTAIDNKHASLPREVRDALGAPVTAELTCADGIGRFRHFRGGSIYQTPEGRVHEIHGAIKIRWAELNHERGFLGYPISDEEATYDKVRRVSFFQKGSIHWSPAPPPAGGAVASTTPTFVPTVRGLFDPESRRHMRLGSPEGTPAHLMNLEDFNDVVEHAFEIFDRVKRGFNDLERMPPPPRPEWGPSRVDIFVAWMRHGFPR
jgi:hypothetical protein